MDLSQLAARVPHHSGPTYCVATDILTVKVTGEQTGGAYALMESVTQPGGGPPPHIHHRECEIFFILEGRYEFRVAGSVIHAEPGDTVFAPRGVPHAFRNIHSGISRMLVGVCPAGAERFFAEAGHPVPAGTTVPLPSSSWSLKSLSALG
jgi:quercetin dioxygenase-like cupin family protein